MSILQKLQKSINKKNVIQNIFLSLAVILLMYLIYNVYRSSGSLQEGKRGKRPKRCSRKWKELQRKKCNKKSSRKAKRRCKQRIINRCKAKSETESELKDICSNQESELNYNNYNGIDSKLLKCITTIGSFSEYTGNNVIIDGDKYPNITKINVSAFENTNFNITLVNLRKLNSIGKSAFSHTKGNIEFKGEFTNLSKLVHHTFFKIYGIINFSGNFPKLNFNKTLNMNDLYIFDAFSNKIILSGNFKTLNTLGRRTFAHGENGNKAGIILSGNFPNLETLDFKPHNSNPFWLSNSGTFVLFNGNFPKLKIFSGFKSMAHDVIVDANSNNFPLLTEIQGNAFGSPFGTRRGNVTFKGTFPNLKIIRPYAFNRGMKESIVEFNGNFPELDNINERSFYLAESTFNFIGNFPKLDIEKIKSYNENITFINR